MYTIKVKMIEDFKIRVMLECQSTFGIVNYKEYVDVDSDKKAHAIGRLEAKAYHFYDRLEKEFKSILNERKFKVTYDSESKLYTTTIQINPELKDCFEHGMYESLSKEVITAKVTEEEVERIIQNYVTRLNDMLDVLT